MIIPSHDFYDWYYNLFNNTDITLFSEKLSYAANTIKLNYPSDPNKYYVYVDTVLLNPWLIDIIHARGKEVSILFSEEAIVGRPPIDSSRKTSSISASNVRASELDSLTGNEASDPNDNNTTAISSKNKKKTKKKKEKKVKPYNNENSTFVKLMSYLQADTLVVKSISSVEQILFTTFSKPVNIEDQIHIFNHTISDDGSHEKQNTRPGYYPDMSNKPHGVTGTNNKDKTSDLDLEKEKWAIALISVSMSYLVFSSVYIGFNIKKVSTSSYSFYRKQLRQSHHDPNNDRNNMDEYHEKKMLSIFTECIAALGWLLFVIGWGNNKSILIIPVPHFLYVLGFLGLLSCILFITVTIATHHIIISVLHCAVEILVILSAGSIYHQVFLYYSHISSLKIVLIGVIIYATCKTLSVGIYMFRWKRSTLENDMIIVIGLIIAFIGTIAFLIGFGRINIVYHVFNSFKYILYYIYSVVGIISVAFLVFSCIQSAKCVNSLTCVFLLISIFSAGGPLTDSFYSLAHHCKYEEEDLNTAENSTIFKIFSGCSYQHQFILAGLLIFIIGETVCFFYHHCYPIYEIAARQYRDYKENFLRHNDVSGFFNKDDPQFSIFKHIKKKGWLHTLFNILVIVIVISSILCLAVYALSPHSFTMVFNTSCVTYTLAGIFYSVLLYVVISRNNRFCFIICETIYLFAIVTSGYIINWCFINIKSLDKGFVILFLSSIIFIICLVTVHAISHLYLHHFTNNLQKSLLFMIKLLSLIGLIIFTVGICRQYQTLLSSELIPGVLLMIFGLLSLICWFEYVVIQVVSLNLFSSLFISISLFCCGFFILDSVSEIADSVNHLIKYIGVLIYCIPIFVSEIFRCWKGSSYKSSLIKASSHIKLFPIGDNAMYTNNSAGPIPNIMPTAVNLLVLLKGSKTLCFLGNMLVIVIISSYLLFSTTVLGFLKYFNVDFMAHIIFLFFGFLHIILITSWFYSVKHKKSIFRILSMVSICSNFSALNVVKWVINNRKELDHYNTSSYTLRMMLVGCIVYMMANVCFQVICFVWKKIELVNYIKSFYLIISAVLLFSGSIMLIIYLIANAQKITSSMRLSIIILLITVSSKILLIILETFFHWAFLKYLSELILWCLPLQSGSSCIDMFISLFKCSQSNCKSLPFTIIFGVIVIFFGSILLLYWKIFRSSRINLKYLSQNYGLHHINIDGGYESYSNIRQSIYVYPAVTISVTLLAFAYIMYEYNFESFKDSNVLVLKEHLITYSLYSYTSLISIIFLVLYLIFELTVFGIIDIITILVTLSTTSSNMNLSLILVHHAFLTNGKFNLVMMTVSMGLSTLAYLVIVVLILRRINTDLDVILRYLHKIKYRCKKIMSYKFSIFLFPNPSIKSSSCHNKNKRINILNIEEDEDDSNEKNNDDAEFEEDNDDKHQFDYDSDNCYYCDDNSNHITIKKKDKGKDGPNKKGKENDDDNRFINKFKHRENDLINVDYVNNKMTKKKTKFKNPRIYYERIFKCIPILVFGIGLLFLFSGLLIGYKGKFSTFMMNDTFYLNSETYSPPHHHWTLFFVAVGAYAFITIEYLCFNIQFFKCLSLLLSMLTYHFSGIILFSFYRLRCLPGNEVKTNPHYSNAFNPKLMNICGILTLSGMVIIGLCIALFYILKFMNWIDFSNSHPHNNGKRKKQKICCAVDINDSS